MTQRKRQAHKGHKPTMIGGTLGVSINCECRWNSGKHFSVMSAWAAFNHHEQELDQEQKP